MPPAGIPNLLTLVGAVMRCVLAWSFFFTSNISSIISVSPGISAKGGMNIVIPSNLPGSLQYISYKMVFISVLIPEYLSLSAVVRAIIFSATPAGNGSCNCS